MANIFDQFDTPGGGGNVFDQFDQAPTAKPEAPLDERLQAARNKIALQNPELFNDASRQVRERQTFTGEVLGGLKDTVNDLATAISPQDQGMGWLERALHVARAPMGLIRAAVPVATLGTSPVVANFASGAGEGVADALAKRGYTTLADTLGAITQAGVDVGVGAGAQKAAGVAGGALKKALPLLREQGQEIVRKGIDASKAVNADAAFRTAAAEAAKGQVASKAGKAVDEITAAVPTRDSFKLTSRSSEEVGKELGNIYTSKRLASKTKFDSEYGAIKEEAKGVAASTDNYASALDEVYGGDKGISRAGQTSAEGNAGRAKNILENTELPDNPTVADLITERQRLRRLGSQAHRNGDDNLARQYGVLEKGITSDLNQAPKSITNKLAATDAAYADQHTPFFGSRSEIRKAFDKGPESVVDTLIPKARDTDRVAKLGRLQTFLDNPDQQKAVGEAFIKNMVDDATSAAGDLNLRRVVSKWGQYADPRTGDKVLKGVLGDRYREMQQLVASSSAMKPKSVADTIKSMTSGVEADAAGKMKTLEGLLGKADTVIEGARVPGKVGSIEATRRAKIEVIDKEVAGKLAKMGVKPISDEAGALVGSAAMLHGAVGMFMGSPAAIPQIATGGLIFLGAPAVLKLMAKARGLELLRKSVRAAPGSTAAAANARIIKRYLASDHEAKDGTD